MPIRFALTGGRSVKCSIAPRPGERVIRFDIDDGKNESTIVIKPGLMIVDGVTKKTGPVAPFLVTASKDSLRITAGQSEIWSGIRALRPVRRITSPQAFRMSSQPLRYSAS